MQAPVPLIPQGGEQNTRRKSQILRGLELPWPPLKSWGGRQLKELRMING
jgi:hypothetical protein